MPNIKIGATDSTENYNFKGSSKIKLGKKYLTNFRLGVLDLNIEKFEKFAEAILSKGYVGLLDEHTVEKYSTNIVKKINELESKKKIDGKLKKEYDQKRRELYDVFYLLELFESFNESKVDQEKSKILQTIADTISSFTYYKEYKDFLQSRYSEALEENSKLVSSSSKINLDGYNKVKSADERWNQLWDAYMNVTATHFIKDPEVVSAKEALDSFLKGLTDPIYESSKAKYENRLKERVVYLEDTYFKKMLDEIEIGTSLTDEQQFQKLESLEEEIKNSVTSQKNVYETRRSNLLKEIKSSLAIKKIQDILGDTFDKMGNSLLNQALIEKNRKKADQYIKEVEDVLEDIVVLSIRDSYKVELAKAKTEVNLIPKTQALIDDEKVLESIDKLGKRVCGHSYYTEEALSNIQNLMINLPTAKQKGIHYMIDKKIEEIVNDEQRFLVEYVGYQLFQSDIDELKRIIDFVSNEPLKEELLKRVAKFPVTSIEEVNKLGQPVKKESNDDLLEKIDKLCKDLPDKKIPYIEEDLSNIQNLMINLPIEDQNRIHNSIDNIIDEIVKSEQDWLEYDGYQLVQSDIDELKRIIDFVSNEPLKEELLEKVAKFPVESIEEVNKDSSPEMAPMPQEPPIKQGTPLNPNEDLKDTVNKMTSTLNSGVPSFTRENANDSDVKKGNTQSIGNLVKLVKSIQKINFKELPDAELNEIYDSIESVMRPFRDLNDCLIEVTNILNERKVENSATVEEVDNNLSSQEKAPVEAPIKDMYDIAPPVDYTVGPENWRSYFEEPNVGPLNENVQPELSVPNEELAKNTKDDIWNCIKQLRTVKECEDLIIMIDQKAKSNAISEYDATMLRNNVEQFALNLKNENEEIKTVDIHTLPDDSNLVPSTSKEDITKACIDNVWNRINQANTIEDCENLMDIIEQNATSNVIPEYDAMLLRNTVQQIAMSLEEPAKRR